MKDRINKVDLKAFGREITSISTPRPGIDLYANPGIVDGDIIGYQFKAEIKAARDLEDGLLEADIYQNGIRSESGNRLHMFHLEVPKDFRGKGIGSILFNAFKEYLVKANFNMVSIRVANGGTKEFFVNKGVNDRFLHTHQFPGARNESVVLTTRSDLESISGLTGIYETAEQIEGVFIEDAFGDI